MYGKTDEGIDIEAPEGWKVLPEGTPIPHVHREFINEPEIISGTSWWCSPRRERGTRTPITAQIYGYVRAYAVPDEETP